MNIFVEFALLLLEKDKPSENKIKCIKDDEDCEESSAYVQAYETPHRVKGKRKKQYAVTQEGK